MRTPKFLNSESRIIARRWIDGWVDGYMGWVNGFIDGWMGRWVSG